MDYFEINKELWNKKTPIHLESEFYDNTSFIEGRSSLNQVELDLLGDIKNKSILHLQCHFGQDSISLSRLGANVTGVDLSDKSILTAKELAIKTNQDVTFVNCNVYDIDKHLTEQYDIIYTSYGTIGWLPDLDIYFDLIQKFLKSDGQFIIVEFHPFVWMWDDKFKNIEHSYFNIKPIIEESDTTYTDGDKHAKTTEVSWNHNFGEIFKALKNNDLQVTDFREYNYSPYDCFNNTIKTEKGYQIKDWEEKAPLLYSLVANKK